jgi:ribosomal protein S18 acetylase RimI-like enzyme
MKRLAMWFGGEGRRHGSRHRARNGHEAELIAALVDASRQRAGHKAELIDVLVDPSGQRAGHEVELIDALVHSSRERAGHEAELFVDSASNLFFREVRRSSDSLAAPI